MALSSRRLLRTACLLLMLLGSLAVLAELHRYRLDLLRWEPPPAINAVRIYGTNDPAAPLPWPLLKTVPGSRTWALVWTPRSRGPFLFYVTSWNGAEESVRSVIAGGKPRPKPKAPSKFHYETND